MNRPVRPVALVILTACALYPGLSMAYQGLYPFVAFEPFALVGQLGSWMDLGIRLGVPVAAMSLVKALVGLAWLAGVPGLWFGDGRAYPVTLFAAAVSLLCPIGPSIMGAIALVCLIGFRETPGTLPA